MNAAAILAALAMAQGFLDNALVCRLLKNVSKKSANRIDDWIISILYGTPEALVPVALADAQVAYDAAPQKVAELKATPSELVIPAGKMPWMETTEN